MMQEDSQFSLSLMLMPFRRYKSKQNEQEPELAEKNDYTTSENKNCTHIMDNKLDCFPEIFVWLCLAYDV